MFQKKKMKLSVNFEETKPKTYMSLVPICICMYEKDLLIFFFEAECQFRRNQTLHCMKQQTKPMFVPTDPATERERERERERENLFL
jgi:hypothetical protein